MPASTAPDEIRSVGSIVDFFSTGTLGTREGEPQPWGADDYLVATHGDEPGIDTGITHSPDGEPITVATITVDDLAGYMGKVILAGGEIVVPRFEIPGLGEACYFTDPTGMVVGLLQPMTNDR